MATGGVAAGSGIGAYSNRVVDRPTLFPFARGGRVGLMGEAGAEAILPLTRTRSGNLGVEARVAPVNINIHNHAGADVTATRNGNDIDVIVRRAVAAVAADMQNGGVTASAAVRANVNDLKNRGQLRSTIQAVI
jgi:phage-related minor tail protein